eukprot:4571210-Pleurochrysis_carterae.AAC.2
MEMVFSRHRTCASQWRACGAVASLVRARRHEGATAAAAVCGRSRMATAGDAQALLLLYGCIVIPPTAGATASPGCRFVSIALPSSRG